MPQAQTIHVSEGITAYFWEIRETEAFLGAQLTLNSEEKSLLQAKKHPKDRASFLAVRLLLNAVVSSASLTYDRFGAPLLDNGQHISISHSTHYAAIVLANVPVGIDVEAHRPKITRIAPRFLHPSENYAQTMASLTQIWTAKEALYKAYRTPGIHFSKQLQVTQCTPNDLRGNALIIDREQKIPFSLTFVTNLPQHHATIAYPTPKVY
ncbi:MAG: 4'-phosphopantetheinyl transferase family protein [Flavobacteriaceae bacterium]